MSQRITVNFGKLTLVAVICNLPTLFECCFDFNKCQSFREWFFVYKSVHFTSLLDVSNVATHNEANASNTSAKFTKSVALVEGRHASNQQIEIYQIATYWIPGVPRILKISDFYGPGMVYP